MNWREMEVIWQRQEAPRGNAADVAELLASFETKRRKLAVTLFVRDVVEAVVGLGVAGFFGWGAWKAGPAYWPMWLAVALLTGLSGFFLRERVRAHRARLGPEASLRDKLAAELTELRHQRVLLARVAVWYLGPAAGALVIVVGTATVNNLARMHSREWLFLAGYGLFCALLFWRIWRANLRVARTRFEPRIAELEKVQRELFSSPAK